MWGGIWGLLTEAGGDGGYPLSIGGARSLRGRRAGARRQRFCLSHAAGVGGGTGPVHLSDDDTWLGPCPR